MDPLHIATLYELEHPRRIWHSNFLWWNDGTLLPLLSSSFGETLIDKADPYISTAIGIACMVEDNEVMEENGSSSSDVESTSDNMADPCR